MSRLLFAIALCMAMQAATAEAEAAALPQAQATTAAAAVAAVSVVQASLSLPEQEAKGSQPAKSTPAMKASLKPGDQKEERESGHRPTTGAMLLAALALMTGIALRRWGAGQQ